jgi:hypothetical protein
MAGDVPTSKLFAATGNDASSHAKSSAGFSFVQISDSHIGFNKAANSQTSTIRVSLSFHLLSFGRRVMYSSQRDIGGIGRLTKLTFRFAGLWGMLVIVPVYFLYDEIGRKDPPVLSHPHFYFGWLGVTLAWQVLFLMLASDPIRYKPMMIPAMFEKLGYMLTVLALAECEGWACRRHLRRFRTRFSSYSLPLHMRKPLLSGSSMEEVANLSAIECRSQTREWISMRGAT